MTLKEYLEKLNKFAADHPDILEREVVYSRDEQGNSFDLVIFGPTTGNWTIGGEEIHGVCIN
jgi:hypothetical protein